MPGKPIHGHARRNQQTRIYHQWHDIVSRCTNPNHACFKEYGERGIKLYDKWRSSFQAFLNFMGPGKKGWTIHRVDNDGGYFPENVIWALPKFQSRHTRRNRIFTVRGITACMSELCERFKAPYQRTRCRVRAGWSIEDAIFVRHNLRSRYETRSIER